MNDLREYIAANMFDGSDEGTFTAPLRTHLDTIVEVVNEWLEEGREPCTRERCPCMGGGTGGCIHHTLNYGHPRSETFKVVASSPRPEAEPRE